MTQHVPIKINHIKWKQSKRINYIKFYYKTTDCHRFVGEGDKAEIIFVPQKPIVVMKYDKHDHDGFARMTMVQYGDCQSLVMIAKIIAVLDDEYHEKLVNGFMRSVLIEMDSNYIVADIQNMMMAYIDMENWGKY